MPPRGVEGEPDEPRSSVDLMASPHGSRSRRRRSTRSGAPPQAHGSAVTLVVYGWSNVEPGTLAWPFPTLQSALDAARALTNATRWAVIAGTGAAVDLDEARASGRVLVETPPGDWLKIG